MGRRICIGRKGSEETGEEEDKQILFVIQKARKTEEITKSEEIGRKGSQRI